MPELHIELKGPRAQLSCPGHRIHLELPGLQALASALTLPRSLGNYRLHAGGIRVERTGSWTAISNPDREHLSLPTDQFDVDDLIPFIRTLSSRALLTGDPA